MCDCMYENRCVAYLEKSPKARKDHRCFFCDRTIHKGETYHRASGVWEDSGPESFAWCEKCERYLDKQDCWCFDQDWYQTSRHYDAEYRRGELVTRRIARKTRGE